jgi:hypothetical protein
MGRFLAFLLVFIIGGVIGFAVGGFFGGVAGAYVGACKAIDQSVSSGTMTQEQANEVVRSIAADLDIKPEQKQIVDQMKKADQPPSPCATAIQAL